MRRKCIMVKVGEAKKGKEENRWKFIILDELGGK